MTLYVPTVEHWTLRLNMMEDGNDEKDTYYNRKLKLLLAMQSAVHAV